MVTNDLMELKVEQIQAEVAAMAQWITKAAREGTAAHTVEKKLFAELLKLGRTLFGGFLHAVGKGDRGEIVTLEDDTVLNRFEAEHKRKLLTVFGRFEISRWVYGRAERQAIELAPTDQKLQLPESEVSYMLQEWDLLLGIEQAFGRSTQIINTMLGVQQSVDTLEGISRHMAQSVAAFREQQPAPDPELEGEILIVTEDNKGVPMVRPADAPKPGAHLTKGQKKNKKQMACVGCVYSVDPHLRTPEELVATLFRDSDRPIGPVPVAQQKRYWVSLTRWVPGETGELEEVHGQTEVFEHMRDDIALRRCPQQKLVHLSDGQRSLETDRASYLPSDENTVDVLDLLHVLPRVWEIGHLFHKEGSRAVEDFVRAGLLRVLRGETKTWITSMRCRGTKEKLSDKKLQKLQRCTEYLKSNLHRLRYDEYLAAGYPIATGVIEGACRHLVRDRMERAGMRWKVPGAQAMLDLRTIHTNGDWETFQSFRIKTETQRLYPHTAS